MEVPPTTAWKLVLALSLVTAILLSQLSRAPARAIPRAELRRLVLAALALYLVGGIASITHHPVLAAIVYSCGIITCTLAAWLSRGEDEDSEDPPGGEDPVDEQPPPTPDGLPEFDWARFEAEFRAETARRSSTPA